MLPQITATEKVNSTHQNKATVTITLIDVNDKAPFFFEKAFKGNVTEGPSSLNTHILTVTANDFDISPEFGGESIR